jgi:hypothetical protein
MGHMNEPAIRATFQRLWTRMASRSVSSGILQGLISEVERTSGYARNDVRAKAKSWLLKHNSSLTAEDVLLAELHFGYLLPAGWRREVQRPSV